MDEQDDKTRRRDTKKNIRNYIEGAGRYKNIGAKRKAENEKEEQMVEREERESGIKRDFRRESMAPPLSKKGPLAG